MKSLEELRAMHVAAVSKAFSNLQGDVSFYLGIIYYIPALCRLYQNPLYPSSRYSSFFHKKQTKYL